MGETVDLIKEFKQAKPPEKAVIILGVVAVGSIAFYIYQKNKNVGPATADTGSSGQQGQQQAGYPTAGGTPVLPPGVNPLYDPNGNLIAFQNPPPSTPASNPQNWYSNILGRIGYNAKITPGGYDVNGQRFWVGSGSNRSMFYAPIGSQINYGKEGRIWITTPGASQQLLTGPGLIPSAKK